MNRSVALILSAVVSTCKPIHHPEDDNLKAFNQSQRGLGYEALSGYSIEPGFLGNLGDRIGCAQSARIAAFPKDTLKNSLDALLSSTSVYETVQDKFNDETYINGKCRANLTQSEGSVKSPQGFLRIYKRVRAAGYGLTFIMNGGYGSHLTPGGALLKSRKLWESLAAADPEVEKRPLRVWRLECSNSYAPDDRCTPELINNIKSKEAKEPSALNHVYILWGYSKGGMTSLQAIADSPEVREKTIAFITVGSPLGGGIAVLTSDPILGRVAEELAKTNNVDSDLLTKFPAMAAMTPSTFSMYIKLFTPEEFPDVLRGSKSLLPEVRKKYLADLQQKDFSRDPDPIYGHKEIQVFHVASLLDVGHMQPFPIVSLQNGRLIAKKDPINAEHLQEMAFLQNYVDFPLSDSCVALQHSVLPKKLLPKNVQSNFLGLLRLGHLSLKLTEDDGDANTGIPYSEVVDAILESTAKRLESNSK